METVLERVERGAALLDEKRPGWRTLIDLETLDLGSNKRCVLGQTINPDFRFAMESLGILDPECWGFEINDEKNEGDTYARLTETWRAVLTR